MLDNLDPRERRTDQPAPPSRESAQRPLTDREVPLAGHAIPAAIHAWLDGELPESAVRHGDAARHVEFWHRIEGDVEVRRHMKTPVHVYEQIMESLPSKPQTLPWWRRRFTTSPAIAILAAAGAIALGLAAGAIIMHAR
jgi:hypothetical protein